MGIDLVAHDRLVTGEELGRISLGWGKSGWRFSQPSYKFSLGFIEGFYFSEALICNSKTFLTQRRTFIESRCFLMQICCLQLELSASNWASLLAIACGSFWLRWERFLLTIQGFLACSGRLRLSTLSPPLACAMQLVQEHPRHPLPPTPQQSNALDWLSVYFSGIRDSHLPSRTDSKATKVSV